MNINYDYNFKPTVERVEKYGDFYIYKVVTKLYDESCFKYYGRKRVVYQICDNEDMFAECTKKKDAIKYIKEMM